MVNQVALLNRRTKVSLCCGVLLLLLSFAQAQQAILGSTYIQRSLDSNAAGTAEAFPVIASSSGQVNSLYLFLDSSNAAPNVWVGVYASSWGHPSTLLTQAAIASTTSGRWNSVAVPPIKVVKGQQYWV